MKVSTRTVTVHHHTVEIDGEEFPTTLPVHEYTEPKVEVDGTKTTLTYAVHDEYPESPRDLYATGTLVVTGNKRDYSVDEPDSDMAALFEIAENLTHAINHDRHEVYLVELCGHWDGRHLLDEVQAGECDMSYEVLIFGTDDDTFPDGSSYGLSLPIDGNGDLESTEGIAAMLAVALDGDRWTSIFELMKAYVEVGRPDVTAFIEWSVQGYSQSDWADGYSYMTEKEFTDPEAALLAEVEEWSSYFRGDVYLLVQETYENGESVDYDCIGGFYGDDAIEAAIQDGGHF
jgi:hypothetical protein